MELLIQLGTVFVIAIVELLAAVPAGLVLGLHPVSTALTATAGASLGLGVAVLLGERVRAWYERRHQGRPPSRRSALARAVMERYGAIGLGLLAPLLVGVPLGAVLGKSMGVPSGRVLLWGFIGVVCWSVLITLSVSLGVDAFG